MCERVWAWIKMLLWHSKTVITEIKRVIGPYADHTHFMRCYILITFSSCTFKQKTNLMIIKCILQCFAEKYPKFPQVLCLLFIAGR